MVERIYPQTHQPSVLHIGVLLIRDEPHHLVGRLRRRAYVLGERHTTLAYAEDVGGLEGSGVERILVDGLDPYTDRPHKGDYEQRHEDDIRRRERDEPVGRREEPLHHEHQHNGHDHRRADPHKVGERREAHNTLIGVENAEPDDEAEEEDPERQHQRVEHLESGVRAVMHGVGQQP